MYIDIHAHLFKPYFKDLAETIKQAEQAGVTIIVVNGLNTSTNREILQLAKKYKQIKAALGIYPTETVERKYLANQEYTTENMDIDEELTFIKQHKDNIVAVGEVGLDYQQITEKVQQQAAFRKVVQLAKTINKPLIVHSRKAEEDVINILEQEQAKKVVMHCFSGNKKLVERIKHNHWFCSIPTNVTRSKHFQEVINIMPVSQLFCETDAPFLSPYKETSNQPAYIIESYKKIAELKGLTLEETKNIIFQNWQRVFG